MKQKWLRSRIAILGSLPLLLFLFVPTAVAFEGREGQRVVIAANEVVKDDLYVAAETFVLNGVIEGDLFVGGTQIEINGTVEGDLFAAGQQIIINGTVKDDVRVAAMAMTLGDSAQVKSDLLFAGFSIETKAGSQIDQELMMGGGQAILAGRVGQDAMIATNGLELLGTIDGDLDAELGPANNSPTFSPTIMMPDGLSVPTVNGGLTLGPDAVITGDLSYRTPASVDVPAGQIGGEISEEIRIVDAAADRFETRYPVANWFLVQLRQLITLFLVGGLLLWLAPSWVEQVGATVEAEPVQSLGWGFVSLVSFGLVMLLIVVATVLLAIGLGMLTLGGLAGTIVTLGLFVLSAVGLTFGLVVGYLTIIAISYLGSRLLQTRLWPGRTLNRYLLLGVGLLLYVLLTAIPIVGGFINFVVMLLGLGGLWMIGRGMWNRYRQAPDPKRPEMSGKRLAQPTG